MRSSNMAMVGLEKRRVDEARVLVLEARLGLLGAVVDEALGQEHRLRGLAELGAQRAAMHQLRLGAPVGSRWRSSGAWRVSVIARSSPAFAGNKKPADPAPPVEPGAVDPGSSRARPFSELFNVAASRPAKSPRMRYGDYRVGRLASMADSSRRPRAGSLDVNRMASIGT